MWQRKLEQDHQEDIRKKKKNRKNPIPPFIIAVVGALLSFLWETEAYIFISAFMIIFGLAYAGQYFLGDLMILVSWLFGSADRMSEPMDICASCHNVKIRDENKICSCGGMLEPLENWEWIED
jgi:hypothetical protein